MTAQAGPGLLLTDALRTLGVPMPLLRQETVERLGTLLPPLTYQRNPVDTGRPGPTYQEVMRAVGEDPGVDLMTVFGLLVLIYVVGRTLIENAAPPGFPFLASVVAIFAGAQMFAIGIIGEYLARMHFRLMEKPTYVVRDSTESQSEAVEARKCFT